MSWIFGTKVQTMTLFKLGPFIPLERSWNTNIKSKLTFSIWKFEFLIMATRVITIWLPTIPKKHGSNYLWLEHPHGIEMFSSKVRNFTFDDFSIGV